jgi:hypothetical protein
MLRTWAWLEILKALGAILLLGLYIAGRIVLHQIRREMSSASSLPACSEIIDGEEAPRSL